MTAIAPSLPPPPATRCPPATLCAAGLLWDAAIGSCIVCRVGLNCNTSGLSLEDTRLLPGFWRPNAGSTAVFSCNDPLRCLGGPSGDASCASGASGILCGVCGTAGSGGTDEGRFDGVGCVECDHATVVWGTFLIVVFLLFVYLCPCGCSLYWRRRDADGDEALSTPSAKLLARGSSSEQGAAGSSKAVYARLTKRLRSSKGRQRGKEEWSIEQSARAAARSNAVARGRCRRNGADACDGC